MAVRKKSVSNMTAEEIIEEVEGYSLEELLKMKKPFTKRLGQLFSAYETIMQDIDDDK